MPDSRLGRAVAPAIATLVFLALPRPADAQTAPTRVTTEAAMAHVATRVEAVLPPAASLVKETGPVNADIIIATDGAVTEVRPSGGSKLLHAAAVDALKQWTFKPFLQDGRPVSVIATVEVTFRRRTDDERQSVDVFTKAHFECRRRLESAATDSRTREACAEAVRLSAQMPAEERWKRSEALLTYGQSLFATGQIDEGLRQLDDGVAMAARAFGPEDADVASVHEMAALFHLAARNFTRADELFATAIKTFEAALKRLPSFAGNYTPRLQAALKRYAQAKQLMNDPAGARALMDRAAALTLPPARPARDPAIERVIAGVRIVGPTAARITEADVQQIQALAGPSTKIWIIDARRPGERKGTINWLATVYFVPDTVTSALRRGRTLTAETTLRGSEDFDSRAPWRALTKPQHYIQVPVEGRDPMAVVSERDLHRPVFVFGERDVFTDQEIVELVGFLRAAGAKSRPAQVRSEIQPWPIEDIMRLQNEQVMIRLLDQDPTSERGQAVRLQRTGTTWEVVQIFATGAP